MKRRSWQMLLPHIGEAPGTAWAARNSSVAASASARVTRLARTRASSPEPPCWRWFHSSMRASVGSSWWMASTGPSAISRSEESVTRVAISMMVSDSGLSPVISRSIQISASGLGTGFGMVSTAAGRTAPASPRRGAGPGSGLR